VGVLKQNSTASLCWHNLSLKLTGDPVFDGGLPGLAFGASTKQGSVNKRGQESIIFTYSVVLSMLYHSHLLSPSPFQPLSQSSNTGTYIYHEGSVTRLQLVVICADVTAVDGDSTTDIFRLKTNSNKLLVIMSCKPIVNIGCLRFRNSTWYGFYTVLTAARQRWPYPLRTPAEAGTHLPAPKGHRRLRWLKRDLIRTVFPVL